MSHRQVFQLPRQTSRAEDLLHEISQSFEVVPTETMRNSMLQLNGCNLKVHRKWWPHVILTWKMSVGTPVWCTVIWWIYYASMIKHSVLDHIIVMQKPLPISIAAELSASINTGLAILNSLANCCPLTGSCQQQPSPWSLCSFTPAWCIFHDLQIKWIDNCRTRIMWARNGNDTDALRRTSSYGRSNSTWAWTVEQWWGSKTKGGFLDLHSVVFHPNIDILHPCAALENCPLPCFHKGAIMVQRSLQKQ